METLLSADIATYSSVTYSFKNIETGHLYGLMIDVRSYLVATRQKESVLRVKMRKLSAAPDGEISKINHKNVQNQLQTPLISDSIQTMDTFVSFPKLEVILYFIT